MRILVVDDDRAVRESLRRALQFNGYTVELADDGQQAMDAVARQRPDAMVLDMMMPRVDGLEVCRRLRSVGHDLPVLVLTAKDAVSNRVAGLDAGADDYLPKPFLLEELLARLRALLRRSTCNSGDPGTALPSTDSEPSTLKNDSCSPPIESCIRHSKRETWKRFVNRRVGAKLRLTAQGLSLAAVVVAIIGLIPPFFGILQSPNPSDLKIIRDDTVSCIPFHSTEPARVAGTALLYGPPGSVTYLRIYAEIAMVADQTYAYRLVLMLTTRDGRVYTERKPIEPSSGLVIFTLDFLPESKGRILVVELRVAAAGELHDNDFYNCRILRIGYSA